MRPCDVLGLDAFNEDDLYRNLDWPAGNQARIEDQLFRSRCGPHQPDLYLCDVTGSYFEGDAGRSVLCEATGNSCLHSWKPKKTVPLA